MADQPTTGKPQPLFVASDIDGFFGLAIDNLVQFLLILTLCTAPFIGFSTELLLGRIIPGAALSILVGNLFYAWQSQKLSARTGRTDVTALPYGINTVSLFAYVLLVMAPARGVAMAEYGLSAEAASELAWQIGLAACFISGLIELFGSFVAEKIRQHTPRAALLSTLAGIAISFIAIDFAIRTFSSPLVALLPLGVILTTYFSHMRMPLRIPGGAWALVLGSAAAWLLHAAGEASPVEAAKVAEAGASVGFYFPVPFVGDLFEGLSHPMTMDFLVPVMIPMGLFNVLGSLQNIESAEAAGDSYPTMPSLAVNGAGTVVASMFGSCFPTTIYIGHPGWKGLGARSGYSILNGVFFAVVALFGLTSLIDAVIPMEAGMAIVLWIGIVMAAQAFQATKRRHAPAVAVGLFPAITGWGLAVLGQTLNAAAITMGTPEVVGSEVASFLAAQKVNLAQTVMDNPGGWAAVNLDFGGLVALSQGFLLTCMIWSAASTHILDRRFLPATIWVAIGAVVSFFGFTHAGHLTPAGATYDIGFGTGWAWSLGYLLCAAWFVFMWWWGKRIGVEPLDEDAPDDPEPA